jgi:hypothetical protein
LSLPKSLGFVAALGLALALQAATGCSGSEFAGDVAGGGSAGAPDPGDGGSEPKAGTTSSGTSGGGTPGSGGSALGGCRGPEDCSDGDPCTQDVCRKDGVCVLSPTCATDERCCEGSCGECCDDVDCDDQVGCTEDICFAGTCQHQPDSASCGAGKYCSLLGDCMSQEACSAANPKACDDDSNCTVDSCESALCVHAFCADEDATRCCPTTGCAAECCTNQECDTDDDPCTVGVCDGGKCSQAPRCSDGEQCCAGGPAGATCGACCSAKECGDDVGCTVDACIEGRCYNAPGACDSGQTCDPIQGCLKNIECEDDGDCSSQGCGRCDEGTCVYGCGLGQVCCNNSCQGCCSAADCSDGIACTDDSCVEGRCKNAANNKNCPLLQSCNIVRKGCILL